MSIPNLLIIGSKRKKFLTRDWYSFRGFEENTTTKEGKKWREVDPGRSKLFAGIAKGISQTGIKEGISVLYLGASHGYTPSFLSDLIGKKGTMLCVDIAPRVVRDLVFVCKKRDNMAPILANCRHPEEYKDFVPEPVDLVFQDIAQKDQVNIFLDNCKAYLKEGGFGLLALKARSVDVTQKPQIIFKQAYLELEKSGVVTVVDKRELFPFEKDHILFVVKRKYS